MVPRALVLAGSRPGVDPLAAYAGVGHKAQIVLEGRTLMERVVTALREAGAPEVAVSTSDETVAELARQCGARVLPAAEGPSQSVGQALEALGAPLLVTTVDHALLQPRWVSDFLADSPAEADISVLMARRELVEAAAPDTRRTWIKFADGQWSGCNLFLLRSARAAGAVALWRRVEADRKRPWRIVGKIGPGTLLRYLLGRLTLAEALARLGALAGAKAAVTPSRDGLAAVDVDKPADLDLVRQITGG
ncbi:nucleotidyltransferase family protein [Phenylobacterium deserti]|uniref:GTP--adenosylcobinamide-phosphate guanylyltransferase n=1 Tax=Phenylobacterium deserti TaxID=1914756 RepID=A0A328AHG2_9CAUL|nr:GTP--adenosylcobinamide-phosphate guanylyltransferase [Phenylobacterium deserti]